MITKCIEPCVIKNFKQKIAKKISNDKKFAIITKKRLPTAIGNQN